MYHDGLVKSWPNERVSLTALTPGGFAQLRRQGGDWRHVRVEQILGHGCFLCFEDGTQEWAALARLRTARPEVCAFATGWSGLGNFLGKGVYYPGTIMELHYDGLVTLVYADGMHERVPHTALRHVRSC